MFFPFGTNSKFFDSWQNKFEEGNNSPNFLIGFFFHRVLNELNQKSICDEEQSELNEFGTKMRISVL